METTARELREKAAEHHLEALASFERSDTDGALSQWANNITSQRLHAEAALLENNGKVTVFALFDLDGNIASVHQGFGEYGEYWVLNDRAAARYGKRFYSPSKAEKPLVAIRNDAKKGFAFGKILVDGVVVIESNGRGMSAIASARVDTRAKIEALKSGDYEILRSDGGRF